jgi:heme-degrading monooxygenase HmoA
MVVEHAVLSVDAERADEVEKALEKASAVIAKAEGFLGMEVLHQVEDPGRYVLAVRWRTLEDHTVTFRQSALASELRELLAPLLVEAPEVRHHEVVSEQLS